MEVWKPIPGYDGQYLVSSEGRIKSLPRTVTKRHRNGKTCTQNYKERMLSATKSDKLGHRSVTLWDGEKAQTIFVHRAVLLAFVGPCPDGMESCHNNGVADDNRLSNLRWDTHLNNSRDRKAHGMYAVGEKHVMAKLNEHQVREIRFGGLPFKAAADRFGIGHSQFYRIKRGETWSHIK